MICKGCGASYPETVDSCPWCGRHKEAPPTTRVEVVVREEGGGPRCPSCGSKNVVRARTSLDSGARPLPVNPVGDPKQARVAVIVWLVVSIMLVLLALGAPQLFAFAIPAFMITFVISRNARNLKAGQEEYVAAYHHYKKILVAFDEMYHCTTCDSVYFPGDTEVTDAANRLSLLEKRIENS